MKARAKRVGELTVREFAALGGHASARALGRDGRTARASHAAVVRWEGEREAARLAEVKRAERQRRSAVRRYGTATQESGPGET